MASYDISRIQIGDDTFNISGGGVRLVAVTVVSSDTDYGYALGGGNAVAGTTVVVTAVVNDGGNFVSWTQNGTVVSTNARYSFTADTDVTLTANFVAETHIWGVEIDQSNSDPEAAVTYIGDAVGMTAGSSDWDDIFGYRPCVLQNGSVLYYLNPNNYAQTEGGSTADITTLGNDVMVEFPKMGYRISTSGDIVTVEVTDVTDDPDFCYKPFSRDAIGDRDYFYYGAYKSYSSGSKLYSSSGKTPTASKTRATYRSEATARGTGYFQNGFYQLIFLQCLYILKYKNRDSQAALGYGYVGGSAAQTTGATNTSGLNYGNTSSQTDRMKLFGIEDFWGNIWQWMDGLSTDASRKYVVTHLPVNFDDATSGTAHTTYDSGITADLGNYITTVQGTTDCGFAAKTTTGSSTTYWADYASVWASCVALFGGDWDGGARAGVFRLSVDDAASFSGSAVASRLMYV